MLLQSRHMELLLIDYEARRLLYLHLFLNYAIEEHSLHIHLMKSPTHNKSIETSSLMEVYLAMGVNVSS
jgi:hypothetical protein